MYIYVCELQHTATHDLWWAFRIPICIRYTYIYIYICMHTRYICIYIYMYTVTHYNTLQHTTCDEHSEFRFVRWLFRVSSFLQRPVRWRRQWHCLRSWEEESHIEIPPLTNGDNACCLLHLKQKHCELSPFVRGSYREALSPFVRGRISIWVGCA